MVETSKENGLDPLCYITFVLEQMPLIDVHDNTVLNPLMQNLHR
ncbi:transposase domain-containing protein [Lysinibacillus xylanilyticus]